MTEEKWTALNGIVLLGTPQSKTDVIELLDRVLKAQGDFGVYGNLSDGVEALVEYMNVSITVEEECYSIELSPKDSFGGHDFSFTINKKTETISDVVVGEVLPQPDFDL